MNKNPNCNNSSASLFTAKSINNQEKLPLNKSLSDNLNTIRSQFSNCADIVFREFFIDGLKTSAAIIFISELVDTKLINESIITSIMKIRENTLKDTTSGNIIEIIKKHFLKAADVNEIVTIEEVIDGLLNGNTVFLLDGDIKALKMNTPGWKERNVSDAKTERTVRGPKEAFTENILTNTSMIRRKIKTHELKFEEYIIGTQTKTKIFISYLNGIADENIINIVRTRLNKIDVDSILESGYIEELIEDTSFTMFPQIEHTERPDKVAGSILEGKVAVLIDGTPFVLIAPSTFVEFFQSSADYYERYTIATVLRIIRLLAFIIAILLPGLFVAVILYHKEMIPTTLFFSIISSGRGVPFPIVIEVLIMDISFEILREAGIRLPGVAGPTVGIVGVLVVGDAAVRAGVVSPITVIIIAITAISSFTIPSYDMGYAIRVLRFLILILGALLGLYGIMLGILMLLIHMCSLKSFGVNYLSPIAPLNLNDLKDVFVRLPWWQMNERPSFSNRRNPHRQKHFLKTNINKDER